MTANALSMLVILAALGGCRAYHTVQHTSRAPQSIVASAFEDKLSAIHFYTLVAHKYELAAQWTKARAARLEIDKIEQSVLNQIQHTPSNRAQLVSEIGLYTQGSPVKSYSLQHLAWKLKLTSKIEELSAKEIEIAIGELKVTREFQVYETNIEHIAYVMKSNARL